MNFANRRKCTNHEYILFFSIRIVLYTGENWRIPLLVNSVYWSASHFRPRLLLLLLRLPPRCHHLCKALSTLPRGQIVRGEGRETRKKRFFSFLVSLPLHHPAPKKEEKEKLPFLSPMLARNPPPHPPFLLYGRLHNKPPLEASRGRSLRICFAFAVVRRKNPFLASMEKCLPTVNCRDEKLHQASIEATMFESINIAVSLGIHRYILSTDEANDRNI